MKYEKNRWSEDEIKLLIENYPNKAVKKMTQIINRPPSAIAAKASALGITKNKIINKTIPIIPKSRSRKGTKLTDYYEQWIKTYKEGAVSDITLEKYWTTLKWLQVICPDLMLQKMTRPDYQNIINEYAKSHERQTTKDFNTQVKAAIQDAFHDRLIEVDPTYKVIIKGKVPRQKRVKFLNLDELRKLIYSLKLDGDEVTFDWFILLVAKTGMRFAEALAITPNDFDWENRLLNIDKTWDYKNYDSKFKPTKNKSSVRKIVVDWQIVGRFKPLVENLPPDEPIFIPKESDGSYARVFNSTFNTHLEKRCSESGISKISMHGLRHTHGSVLLSQGVSIMSISQRLGHANVTTTQEVYLHVIKELEEKDNEKMLNYLSMLG